MDRTGARHLGVGLDVGGVDDGVRSVPLDERVDGGRVTYVGVDRAHRDHLVARGSTYDVAAEVAGASTGDQDAHDPAPQ